MAVNGVKEENGDTDMIYYELDGEGDADSSTTPNVDHRDREYHSIVSFYDVIGFNQYWPCEERIVVIMRSQLRGEGGAR